MAKLDKLLKSKSATTIIAGAANPTTWVVFVFQGNEPASKATGQQ